MPFRRLMQYGERLDDGAAYYRQEEISLVVDIESETGAVRPVHMGSEKLRLHVPKALRTSGTQPFLLVDGPEYVLGLPIEEAEHGRAEKRRAAYWGLLGRCATETGSRLVRAVASLEHNTEALSAIEERLLGTVLDRRKTKVLAKEESKRWIAFRVDGRYVHDEPAVAAFWADEVERESASGDGVCSVCGHLGPLAEKSPVKAKGVSAAAVTSARKSAFESFGLKKYRNTSVCLGCSRRVAVAFNDLMDWDAGNGRSLAEMHNRGGSQRIGGGKIAYWSTGHPGFAVEVMRCLKDPSPADVKELLRSPIGGRRASLPEHAFHSFTASGNSGRVVFRDWIDVPLRQIQDNLRTWFECVDIVGCKGEELAPLGIGTLLESTVRRPKDIRWAEALALWRTALLAAPLPQRVQSAAVRRSQAERKVTHPRAGLLKAALLYCAQFASIRTNENKRENGHMNTEATLSLARLNPNHPSAAYHLGRLLAVLDDIQYQAQGIRTVVDRNIGGATNSPMTVFPRLLEMARKAHLPKIERAHEKGRRYILQKRLESLIPEKFPLRLGLEERSLFMIGLYHEEADRGARIAAAKAAKAGARGE